MSLFNRKESGQGLVEYALILLLVGIVAVTALTLIGPQISEIFNQVTTTLGGDLGKDNVVASLDNDGDGLTDDEEAVLGTDPYLPDSGPDGQTDRENFFLRLIRLFLSSM